MHYDIVSVEYQHGTVFCRNVEIACRGTFLNFRICGNLLILTEFKDEGIAAVLLGGLRIEFHQPALLGSDKGFPRLLHEVGSADR